MDGERGRNRTFNLLIKSQLLCQLSYAPVCGFQLRSWEFRIMVAGMGDCSYCSREAAFRNHRIGRMRLPITNITQPLIIAPTVADLEVLARLNDKPQPFSSTNFLLNWARLATSRDENNAGRFCRACADSALNVSARARNRSVQAGHSRQASS
jgi:hypothetical protein